MCAMHSQKWVRERRATGWSLRIRRTSSCSLAAALTARPRRKGVMFKSVRCTEIGCSVHAPGSLSASLPSASLPAPPPGPASCFVAASASSPPAAAVGEPHSALPDAPGDPGACGAWWLRMASFQTSATAATPSRRARVWASNVSASRRSSESWSRTTSTWPSPAGGGPATGSPSPPWAPGLAFALFCLFLEPAGAAGPPSVDTSRAPGITALAAQPRSDASQVPPRDPESAPARASAARRPAWRGGSAAPMPSSVRLVQPRRLHFGVESRM
mmetsp:Transcript_83507/g.236920  ORF Transcript_83507/g.236920 Transcript_83507/m.236920 type:complete len:272 (+) Transcript_83507:127-942(+)